MTQLSKSAFLATYADSVAGQFPSNTTQAIGSVNLRNQAQDIADSVFFIGASGFSLTTSTSITQSAMNSAFSVPVAVIPAQGTGVIIAPIGFLVHIQYGSAAFATHTTFRFEIDGEAVSDTNTTILPSVADRTVNIFVAAIDTANDYTNKPCVLQVLGGDPTGGTGSIIFVSAVYSTLNVA